MKVVNLEQEKQKKDKENLNLSVRNKLLHLLNLCDSGRLDDIDIIFRLDGEKESVYTGAIENINDFDSYDLIDKIRCTKSFATFKD